VIAKENISKAEICIETMKNRSINISRANESLSQALQIYDAQIYLEQKGNLVKYDLVNKYASQVCEIMKFALQAQDEFFLFNETWYSSAKKFDLSPINGTYKKIINSFYNERFEETIELINEGYKTLSEFESSQTMLTLFYESTKKNFKNFIINHYKEILKFFIFLVISFLLSFNFLRKKIIKKWIKDLKIREISLDNLLKKTQYNYFKQKTMSEIEYKTKIEVLGKIKRDLDKQLLIFEEKLKKIESNKSLFFNKNN
jgi:hypothetical protein